MSDDTLPTITITGVAWVGDWGTIDPDKRVHTRYFVTGITPAGAPRLTFALVQQFRPGQWFAEVPGPDGNMTRTICWSLEGAQRACERRILEAWVGR